MPIYEYYCPDNHTVYQFFAKTLAQGKTVPKCPDNPKYRMQKSVSAFAVTGTGKNEQGGQSGAVAGDSAGDARMEAAMGAMEREFSSVDENDPRAMGRMMRRMAEMTGEKIDGEMEEVVRKLEEGADPESLDDQLGGEMSGADGMDAPPSGGNGVEAKEKRHRYKRTLRPARRDPQLYDYC
ncbi:MAG: FmdB family transcriptional regulator [Nibricoccus sp.]